MTTVPGKLRSEERARLENQPHLHSLGSGSMFAAPLRGNNRLI